MLPEQQQRILGYFLEEARDHLNTIEQGLLNLQSTLNDPELINEVFRAAHSIKGGAAMLGLTSIQHTSHRLEDCFKVLKENPVQVDQKLESLFLGVSDTLKALLEQLSSPFGLSEETANNLMSETEPVFQWLNQHLELLVQETGATSDSSTTATQPQSTETVGTLTDIVFQPDVPNTKHSTPQTATSTTATGKEQWSGFQTQVLQTLREMLQLFKQKATPESRQNLQQCCYQLVQLGEAWNLPNWCHLCQAAASAIGNTDNTYLTLAKIVITEIKQAQELVLNGRETEIIVSQQLEALWSFPETVFLEVSQDLLGDVPSAVQPLLTAPATSEYTLQINAIPATNTEDAHSHITVDLPADSITNLTEVTEQLDSEVNTSARAKQTENEHDFAAHLFLVDDEVNTSVPNAKIDTHGPEVGLAELNTLADLFEGETPELDEHWQQEEVIEIAESNELGVDISETVIQEFDNDLADFLSLDSDIAESPSNSQKTDDFGLLFGEHLAEPDKLFGENSPEEILQDSLQTTEIQDYPDVLAEFLNITSESITSPTSETQTIEFLSVASLEESNIAANSFDDLFIEPESTTNILEEVVDHHSLENLPHSHTEDLSIDHLFCNLDENPQSSTDTSATINNLFDEQPLTALEFAAPTGDVADVTETEAVLNSEELLISGVDTEIAKELEASLFAAASELFHDGEELATSDLETFDITDLQATFIQPDEEVNLILDADAHESFVAELNNIDSTISNSVDSIISDRQLSPIEIADISELSEALDLVPEFTNQTSETVSVDSQLSFADFAVDLFADEQTPASVSGNNSNVDLFAIADDLSLPQTQAAEINLDNSLDIGDTDPASEFSLVDNLLGINNELPTTNLEEWVIPISELTDIVIQDKTEDNSQAIAGELLDTAFGDIGNLESSELTIDNIDLSDALSTTVIKETNEFNFGELATIDNELITENADLTEPLSIPAIEETSEFNFGELATIDNELITENIDLTESLSTPAIQETSEFNFSELANVDLNESLSIPTIQETSEFNFGELATIDNELITENADLTESLSTPVIEEISEFNFGELATGDNELITDNIDLAEPLSIPAIQETGEFNFGELATIDNELITENPDLTESSSTPAIQETSEFNFGELAAIDNELITENADLAESLSIPAIQETSELNFVGLVNIDNELVTEHIDLADSVSTPEIQETSEFNFGELANINNELITENLEPVSAETLETSELIQEEHLSEDTVTSDDISSDEININIQDEFAGLDALLDEETTQNDDINAVVGDEFADLEALLDEETQPTTQTASQTPVIPFVVPKFTPVSNSNAVPAAIKDEFSDLEQLLADADKTISQSTSVKPSLPKPSRPTHRRQAKFEETMKVPVKQLDDMSNLVGELVVNRNTLEQDHERLRQSLDNLLIQVQQLSDVGARMQELYERSLLEASLLASRKTREAHFHRDDTHSERGFSELEMDRFTPFHTLSQEMIELIVRVRESASDIDFVTEETERVARQFRQVTTQLQEGLTRARMVPFSQTIDRLRRGVRDNAIKCGKQVELVIEGGDTLIDKMILDHLTDPLTHMLNNAIAHGIETPDIRQASGKLPVGMITIRAFHQGNQTVISVGDDGAGIDTERIKALAVKRGLMTPQQAKTISRLEIYDLLFQAGFSTKDEADEISGRGVGMDVVRSEISEIRGTVNTDSVIGKGTTFTIRLPLTLSICKALCCVSDKARIAFSMDGVEDTLDIPLKNIQKSADGQSYISWRDTILPFRPLKELLTFNRQLSRGNVYGGTRDDDMISVVVVRSGNTLLALQIDQVLSEQEIVIKQFEGPAPKPIGVAGATVLGDGRIMPIADVLELIDIFQGRMSKDAGSTAWQQSTTPTATESPSDKIDPTVLIVDDSITVRELLSLTFNKAGYRVEQARDGQEAWDKLRSGLPCDIVFCDIEMPRCDGLELLSRIQKDTNLNHLPIAMLTSRGADKHRQMAIQLGASGYFTKPYLEEALLEAAVRMLKGEKLVHTIGNG